MKTTRIAELLRPFLETSSGEELSHSQLQQLSDYLDLLVRWNAKTNLTSVRESDAIVRRHFGESLFLARNVSGEEARTAIDIGSGAGFPGIPLKIYSPHLRITLIESQNKKATFLNEVIRKLILTDIDVFPGRAEGAGVKADMVTLRAVEKFAEVVPVAIKLLNPGGRLALLISAAQSSAAKNLLSGFDTETRAIPESRERILMLARNQG